MKFGLPDDFELEFEPPPPSREAVLRCAENDVFLNQFSLPVVDPSPYLARTTALSTPPEYQSVKEEYLEDVEYLAARFRAAVRVQSDKVTRYVALERERMRKAQEAEEKQRQELERKQREEQERRRLELEKAQREEQERLKKQEEQDKRKQQELEAQKQEALRAQEEEKKQKELLEKEQEQQRLDADVALKAEKLFVEYKQAISHIKTSIVTVVNENKEMKKQIGVVRRKINPKFGQLSNSMTQLRKIASEVIELVSSVQQYELPFKFILNFIAKAIVSQAETEVVVQPNAAVPLAKLTSNLLERFPDLNYYLMARFVKKCPLIIGYTCDTGSEEGRVRMGWKRNKETSKWEEEDKYDERVAGICSVWSVLTTLGNPAYPIASAWSFLARIANTPLTLVRNVHFFCLANWWEACGRFFVAEYKLQAYKLLHLIAFELTSKVDKKYPAATRLKLLGEDGISTTMNTLKEMAP